VKFGSTAVGIETTEGIVLAAEKRIYSKLQVPSSMEKIMKVYPSPLFSLKITASAHTVGSCLMPEL
jgi:20S proteasome alpha/beta subunit